MYGIMQSRFLTLIKFRTIIVDDSYQPFILQLYENKRPYDSKGWWFVGSWCSWATFITTDCQIIQSELTMFVIEIDFLQPVSLSKRPKKVNISII